MDKVKPDDSTIVNRASDSLGAGSRDPEADIKSFQPECWMFSGS